MRSRGFTLIEVMITVAIVAILAAIAVPSYSQYVTRSRITEAVSALSTMRVKMEQFYQDNRRYTGACANGQLASPPTGTFFGTTCSYSSDGNGYVVTATGTGNMSGFVYTIDQSNNQRTTGLPLGWAGASPTSTCWVLRRDGSC